MSDFVVTPWKRYGKDRLYVTASDGLKVGYWDVTDASAHPEPGMEAALAEALTAHGIPGQAAAPAVEQAPAAAPVVEPPPAAHVSPEPLLAAPEKPWTDLAHNRPGEAAREQAVALKEAAPVKTVLARVLGVKTDERAWRIGADGEEAVAARLAKLGPRWRILHAVPVGTRGSDIDHVVIGPGGVYTINTKHHPDAKVWAGGDLIRVDGNKVQYVRNSRFEAQRAGKMLTDAVGFPVHVTGVIAFMGVRGGFTVKSQPADGLVHITTRKDVTPWLAKRAEVLTDMHVEAIYDAARRSTTWT